jgi:hypothetical protein
VLLSFARANAPSREALALAADVAAMTVSECNRALRDAYGEANLPPELAT